MTYKPNKLARLTKFLVCDERSSVELSAGLKVTLFSGYDLD